MRKYYGLKRERKKIIAKEHLKRIKKSGEEIRNEVFEKNLKLSR